MALHKLEREEGEIIVRVLEKGEIINGKYYPRGYVEVVSGVLGERYVLTPKTATTNYKKNQAFYKELLEKNGGKL